MSKTGSKTVNKTRVTQARLMVKYGTAGAVTALYAGAVWAAYRLPKPDAPIRPAKVAVIAGGLTAATWLAALM